MIVTKKTIEDVEEIKKVMDGMRSFKNIELINFDKPRGVVFTFKIVGRKVLEFCIIGTNNELVADITNKTTQRLSDFKWGTAKIFSKTLVKSWDKLCAYEDGEFKI